MRPRLSLSADARLLVHRLGPVVLWAVVFVATVLVGALVLVPGGGEPGEAPSPVAEISGAALPSSPVPPDEQVVLSVPTTVPPTTAPPPTEAPTTTAATTTSTAAPRSLPPGFPVPRTTYVAFEQPSADPGAPTVAVVGDSLTVGASNGFRALFSEVHLRFDARGGRTMQQAVRPLLDVGAASADVVVVALGTNDSCSPAECRGRVEAIYNVVGSHPVVVWMLPHRFYDGMDLVRAVIADEARQHGRTVLVDWQVWVDRFPEILTPDGVHCTAEGYRLRAQVTADEVMPLLR